MKPWWSFRFVGGDEVEVTTADGYYIETLFVAERDRARVLTTYRP